MRDDSLDSGPVDDDDEAASALRTAPSRTIRRIGTDLEGAQGDRGFPSGDTQNRPLIDT
jgi:hypothetical protein